MTDKKNDFFRLPGVFSLFAVPFGLGLVTMAVLAPGYVPLDYLGPVGNLIRILILKYPAVLKGIFYTAWLLHSGEALYAIKTARAKKLQDDQVWKWGLVTLFYGGFAMKYLMSYSPKQKST
jgi:hypothetical protein